MVRILVALAAASLAAAATAPAARAETQYGGAAVREGRPGASISLVVRDDATVAGRVIFTYACRRERVFNVVVRLSGRVNGSALTATGRTRLGGAGTLRHSLSGTLTPDAASGTIRLRTRCGSSVRQFVLRSAAAPAGPPTRPARGTLLHGMSTQAAAGVRMPVSVRVATNGRVYAVWSANMRCGRRSLPLQNLTPPTAVRADGSFSRSETFTIRYRGGYSERYRVHFSGRFLADGAVGTLRARMRGRQRGRRYVPCDSGTRGWAARP